MTPATRQARPTGRKPQFGFPSNRCSSGNMIQITVAASLMDPKQLDLVQRLGPGAAYASSCGLLVSGQSCLRGNGHSCL